MAGMRTHAGRPLLLLHCPLTDTATAAKGKGAAESAMLDIAFNDDRLADGDLVLKVTGRLFCANAPRLIAGSWSANFLAARATIDLSYFDSRLFYMRADTYRRSFVGMQKEIDDSTGLTL